MDAREDVISRFCDACLLEDQIVAAFVGGSLAADTADAVSDVDIYAITREADYARFFARREIFIQSWARPLLLLETLNFEGLGFDMLHFVLDDGVHGELALGHTGNFRVLHGGRHRVLVDKMGLLDGVTFPLHVPSVAERRQQAERALSWFWLDFIQFRKHLYRQRPVAIAAQIAHLRAHCTNLLAVACAQDITLDVDVLTERLAATVETGDPVAVARAVAQLHQELGPRIASHFGLAYPTGLAMLLSKQLSPQVEAGRPVIAAAEVTNE